MLHFIRNSRSSIPAIIAALLFAILETCPLIAQVDSVYSTIHGQKYSPFVLYRSTPEKINDLVHTRLAVSFDFAKAWLYGKEWVTLHPHFYAVDSLTLDAKGMDIHEVDLVQGSSSIPLQYDYTGKMKLRIRLDKKYSRDENYTIYIEYTSKPNEIPRPGSNAIIEAKGLYFINPDGSDTHKPVQVWTQGETESNSCWFPTIDHPNQKTTEEIAITVPDKFVTLSNGVLSGQQSNSDGTRTDTWKLDKPHSPYLFMMAVGDFNITEDHWNNIPVDYYLEPAYAPYARQIFGNTPEMIGFYSRILGIDFPWPKYAQVVVRDYVSGAMENTTATLHGEYVQRTPRELMDDNSEAVISHELFHHWFGDDVTTESWSNITVNESFADFAETLWFTYKYGKDKGDENNYNDLQRYLGTPYNRDHNLVPFYYRDREQVFDNISYPKGGYILNMLKNYVGDSAFFASLHEYLVRHAYSNAEAQDLRLAFEDVTGKDLSWFWDQWYYGKGYPELDISYDYDDSSKIASVVLKQIQDNPRIFRMPMAIDVYAGNKKQRIMYQMDAQSDTVKIPYPDGHQPDLINVDGDKVLLARVHDHKTTENFLFQYTHAGTYVDRREAIEGVASNQGDPKVAAFLIRALNDPYEGLRTLATNSLDLDRDEVRKLATPYLEKLAQDDPVTRVRAAATRKLAGLKDKKEASLFLKAMKSPSYAVEAAGLYGINALNEKQGLEYARKFLNDHRGPLNREMAEIFAKSGSPEFAGFFSSLYGNARQRFMIGRLYIEYLTRVKDPVIIRQSVDQISEAGLAFNNPRALNALYENLHTLHEAKSGQPELSNYIQGMMEKVEQRLSAMK